MRRHKRQADSTPGDTIRRLNFFLCLLITLALVLKFYLIFHLKIHGDEFYFLSHVFSHLRDSLNNQFQTFHVHFFTWLPLISDNEVDQVIAARIIMYMMLLGSSVYTYLIGRRFLNRPGALFAVLCYISISNVVEHGASFRADSICSFLFLLSVYLILTKNQSVYLSLTAGIATAIALMVSIKSVFYLITIFIIFAIVLFIRPDDIPLKKWLLFIVSFLLTYTYLFAWHLQSITNDISASQTGQFLGSVLSKVILRKSFFPGLYYFLESLRGNVLIWILLFIGLGYLLFKGKSASKLEHQPVLMSFLSLLTPLLFYRNSFPYFYVFIISPAIVLSGVILHRVTNDFLKNSARIFIVFAYIFAIPVFGNFLFHFITNVENRTEPQRKLLATVHQIFPEPVPYIDRCAAIASFPKIGIFMSSWGMENYLAAGKPIFSDLIKKGEPIFIFADTPNLDLSLPRETQLTSLPFPLMEEDWDVLNKNFIHHWGILYILGKNFELDMATDSKDFEILVPGVYTVESSESVIINGYPYNPGDTLFLDRGNHTIQTTGVPVKVSLRWGKNLFKPSIPAPQTLAFYGF